MHVALAFAGAVHWTQPAPHAFGSVFDAHVWPQRCEFSPHDSPHVPLLHVAVPPPGVGHGEHDAPQLFASLLLTHLPPQLWKPALQTMPHEPCAHVAWPLVGEGHAFGQLPQCVTVELKSTHWLPQSVGAWPEQPFVQAKPPLELGAQFGAPDPHAALHAPQWVACERSVSQPSSGLPLQSA